MTSMASGTQVRRLKNRLRKKYRVPWTTRLSPDVMQALRHQSEQTGLTMTKIVERALAPVLFTKGDA